MLELKAARDVIACYFRPIQSNNNRRSVKNGADCYSKIGHAVTVLRWQS